HPEPILHPECRRGGVPHGEWTQVCRAIPQRRVPDGDSRAIADRICDPNSRQIIVEAYFPYTPSIFSMIRSAHWILAAISRSVCGLPCAPPNKSSAVRM